MLGTLNSPQIQWEQGMPRVAQDSQLAERVQAFVKACGGFGTLRKDWKWIGVACGAFVSLVDEQ